jgi:hypothetical protein
MKVGILPGDFTVSLDEELSPKGNLVLSTAYNVVPIWLRIANDNLRLAKEASRSIAEEWDQAPDKQKSLLVDELGPAMQVFVACGIALDALYDTLRPYAKISDLDLNRWKEKGTSRASQIVEILRRTHKLEGDILKSYKQNIGQIIKFRDQAVHPSLELRNACDRPDIPVGVDWKFSAYRYSNAEWCLTNAINMICYLFEHNTSNPEIDSHIANIIEAMIELKVVKKNA